MENEQMTPRQREREKCIRFTMDKTGWSREEAVKHIDDARERIRITHRDYRLFEMFRTPEENQKEVYERKKELRKKRKAAYAEIMGATGWSEAKTRAEIARASARTHCTWGEYRLYRFYELTDEQQDDIFVMWYGRQIRHRYDVDPAFVELLGNKERTNIFFADYVRRPWCVNTKTSLQEFMNRFKNSRRIIYKPLLGIKGIGVQAFDVPSESALEACYRTLSGYPEGVVEQYVAQHPKMNQLTPASVNTIRVVTVSSNTRPVLADGSKMDIAYASVRVGGGNAVVDNFHSGGMTANIDLDTGIIVTDATDMDGRVFKSHPVTGTVFRGFEIPYFKETLEMIKEAIRTKGVQGYLGWDIAISETGPQLIEVNTGPGPVLLTTPYAVEHKGSKHVMSKYLWKEKNAKVPAKAQSKRAENREKCIEYAMQENNWSRETAIDAIEDAKARTGISYRDYRVFRMARIAPDEQETLYKKALKKREEQAREREEIYTLIMCGTGWNRERAEEEVKNTQKETHCTLKDFQRYRFWTLTREQQLDFYLQRQHRKMRDRYKYDVTIRKIVESKEETNRYFNEFITRPWCVNKEISKDEFFQLFAESAGVVYKPVFGLQGSGVEAFSFAERSRDEVYDILAVRERGVIEEFIIQNPVLNRFNANSVNTIRFYSISSRKKAVIADGRHADIATATVKLGGSNAVVDNLHAGHGVCAAVDLKTGEIITNGIDWNGNAYIHHPRSKVKIKGTIIPFIKEAQEMIYAAIDLLKIEGVIGWDIAIGQNGPILVEPNVLPDPVFVNLPYTEERKGMLPYMRKYFWD